MSDVIVCKVPESEHCPSGVCVVVPSLSASIRTALETIPKDTIEHKVVHRDDCPKDRYFRNAWKFELGKLDVDMPKARKIHIDNLRKKRNDMLDGLDKEYMMALESADMVKQNEIKTKKQKLRDMPNDPIFAGAANPEALKAAIPDELK